MDTIHLRARLDAIEARLNVMEAGDGGRFPSHGTRGSLSRPIVDGGVQPRDIGELNDVPDDRDDDLMPEAGAEGDQVVNGADQAAAADQANGEARKTSSRRRAATTGKQRVRSRARR